MKKMIMLAAVITVGFSITAGLSYAANAQAKQAAALAYYNNAVYKEAVAGEEYAIQIADNSDAADAEAVIARSNLADAAVETMMLDKESDAVAKAKEMASVCDDDIETAVAKFEKEHTPTASTTTPTPASIAAECASRPGMYGRLRIPSVGINVAVFSINSQATIDARDSAAIYGGNGGTTIADHQNQGFRAIANCVPGSTVAYIDTPEGTQRYICSVRMTGHNVSTALTDDALNVFTYGGLIMYTCRDNSYNIWIVCFDPV